MTPASEPTPDVVEVVAKALEHLVPVPAESPNGNWWDGQRLVAEEIATVAITAYESARGDVKPGRVQLAHRLFEADCYGLQPADWGRLNPGQWDSYFRMADAILALWPGRSEREAKAEALREAAWQNVPGDLSKRDRQLVEEWLNDRATALEQGAGE